MAKLIDTSYDNQFFYQWDGLANQWVVLESQFDSDFPPLPQDPGTSLATHIIKEVFGLTLDNNSENIGSYLPGYDVVNRDAYQMVQLSLAAELVNDRLVECYADENGVVKFYDIGTNPSSVSSDVLYSFTQATWKQKCDTVLVFGYDPPEKRLVRGDNSDVIGYDLFTLSNAVNTSDLGPDFQDNDLGLFGYPKYWVNGAYLTYDACPQYKEGAIEYSNVALSTQKYLDQIGVFHYREFEQIDGYLYKVQIPFFKEGSTHVEFRQRTLRYTELKGFGKLLIRKWKSNLIYTQPVCDQGQLPDADVGIVLPRSDEKKFAGLNAVYIIGFHLKQIECDERLDPDSNTFTSGPADFIVDLDTMDKEPIKLNEGEDYILVKEQNSNFHKIVFSCNVNPNYAEKFGKKFDGSTKTKIRVSRTSLYDFKNVKNPDGTSVQVPYPTGCAGGKYALNECFGSLRDGKTATSDHAILEAVIFPTGDGLTGYVVTKIIVVYEWDNPSVAIFDQRFDQITEDNLKKVTMQVFPIIVKNPPQYVAANGQDLDPSEQLPDMDATTVEDLYNKPYQLAMSSLENADIRITLPFLDNTGCRKVADKIFEVQTQEVEVTTYVCGPEAEPVLGEVIDGKTINSIEYSYQDSSQYLISVNAGPTWQGVTSWDNAIYQNGTERLQLEGIVRFVYDNNMRCVVQLEQIGLMECVNGQQQPLEAGDTVKVTVYNNPVRR